MLDLSMQRAGFTSRAGYLKYLVRKEASSGSPADIAAMIARIPEEMHGDFDAALLMITEAPEEKRPSLLAKIGTAIAAMLNPKTRRDLGWKSITGTLEK